MPFRVPTKDGERLFAWLIAPLEQYARHADQFIGEESGVDSDIEEKVAFKLLRADPNARLLIYCMCLCSRCLAVLTSICSSWCKF